MRTLRFYRDEEGWFVDLPEWTGEKKELQMVSGADIFLDILSQSENEVYLKVSTEMFPGCETLNFIEYGEFSGAWYKLLSYKGMNYELEMWLCDVTKNPIVFGNFPRKIYFK